MGEDNLPLAMRLITNQQRDLNHVFLLASQWQPLV
jgi:hypothetical protein